jgi:hypothetical protein
MTKVFRFLVSRLSEGATYRGVVMIATAAGVTWRPEMVAAITSAGMAVAGLIGILFPDPVAPTAPAAE